MRLEDVLYEPPERMGGVRHTHPPGVAQGKCLRLDDDVPRLDDDVPGKDRKQDENQHKTPPGKDGTP